MNTIICKRCGRTIEYADNEVQSNASRDYGGGWDVHRFIKCPADDCGGTITILEK
jgi:hypothetical protein